MGNMAWRPGGGPDARGVAVDLELEYKGVIATASYVLPAIMPKVESA